MEGSLSFDPNNAILTKHPRGYGTCNKQYLTEISAKLAEKSIL